MFNRQVRRVFASRARHSIVMSGTSASSESASSPLVISTASECVPPGSGTSLSGPPANSGASTAQEKIDPSLHPSRHTSSTATDENLELRQALQQTSNEEERAGTKDRPPKEMRGRPDAAPAGSLDLAC